jgi:hypothetical protein
MEPKNLTLDELASRIEPIAKIGAWIKALMVGAFLLGIWAATLQSAVSNLQVEVARIQIERAKSQEEWREWREQMTRSMARQEALIEQALAK